MVLLAAYSASCRPLLGFGRVHPLAHQCPPYGNAGEHGSEKQGDEGGFAGRLRSTTLTPPWSSTRPAWRGNTGRHGAEYPAGFAWNGWPACVEYAHSLHTLTFYDCEDLISFMKSSMALSATDFSRDRSIRVTLLTLFFRACIADICAA